jgi:hypothetical protein
MHYPRSKSTRAGVQLPVEQGHSMSTAALSGVYLGLVGFSFPRLQPGRNLLDLFDSALCLTRVLCGVPCHRRGFEL